MALGRIALVSIKGIVREIEREISGVMSISLENAVENGLLSLTAYGGTEQRNLPSGYTELEYIESTGTQYINTGITSYKNTDKMKMKFTTTQTANTVFLTFQNPNAGASNIGLFIGSSYLSFQYGNVDRLRAAITANTVYEVETTNGSIKVNGVETTSTEVAEFQVNGLLYIGAATLSGGEIDTRRLNGRIYYFRYEDKDGNVLFDGVPVKDTNNIVGLYDKVTGTFFTNQGTGTFTAGPDVVPTPTAPMDIVSNNGVLKFSKNMANVNAQTALVGYYISTSGVITADVNNRIYQDFIPCKPNTTYTLSFSSSVYFVSISEYSTAEDSGFIRRNAGTVGGNTTLTIITASNTRYIRFGTNIRQTAITLQDVLAIDWMLNEGNTMPYQPYADGGIYADGTVETIWAHTKNLCNTATPIVLTPSSGSIAYELTPAECKFKENTRYTITYRFTPEDITYSEAGNLIFTVVTYTDGTTSYDQGITTQNISDGIVSRTTRAGKTVASITGLYRHNRWTGGTITITGIQIEEGTSSTEYVPYFDGGTATAEMLLKVGDYQDEQEILSGGVTRNVGVKVLDGTEDWVVPAGTSGFYSIRKTNFTPTPVSSSSTAIVCSHASAAAQGGTPTPQTCGFGVSFFNFNLNGDNSAVLDFKTWLADQYAAGTPVIVVYPLATPTTETVTGQTMNIQAGDNTIEITQASLDDLELSAEYKALPSN